MNSITYFFNTQMDYVFFFYGLAFIMLSAVCFILMKDRKQKPRWIWLGMFGLTHGVHKWINLLTIGLDSSQYLEGIRVFLGILSFVFLLEFGLSGITSARGSKSGRWIFIPLLAITASGSFWGINGLDVSSRYTLGLTGGILSSLALFYAAKKEVAPKIGPLRAGSLLMGLYALTTGIVVRDAPFFPASMLNNTMFSQTTGFPIQLVKGMLAIGIALSIWIYSQTPFSDGSQLHTYYVKKRNTLLYFIVMIAIIISGWALTEFAGNRARAEEIKEGDLHLNSLAIHLLDHMDEVDKLGHAVIRTSLNDIEAVMKNLSNCFLVDSTGTVFLSGRAEMLYRKLWSPDSDAMRGLLTSDRVDRDLFRPILPTEPVEGKLAILDGNPYVVSRSSLGNNKWSLVLLNRYTHIRNYRLFAIFTTFVLFNMTMALFSALYFTRESAAVITASERRYRSLVEGSPNCVMLFDRQGRCRMINKSGTDLTGFNEAEILDKDIYKLFSVSTPRTMDKRLHSEEAKYGINEIITNVLSGKTISFDAEGIRPPDMQLVLWRAALNPVYDHDGQIRYFMGIFTDITSRKKAEDELRKYHEHLADIVAERTAALSDTNKRLELEMADREKAEEALRDSEKRFRSFFNLASDAIFLYDPANEKIPVIIDANISACSMHGYTRKELLGKPLNFLLNQDSGDKTEEIYTRLMSGDTMTFEIEHVRKDGSIFPLEVSAQSIYLSGKPFILGIERDITERKQTEKELSGHREQLLEMVEERTFELKTAVRLLNQEVTFRKGAEEVLKESEAGFRELSQQFHALLDAIPDSLLLVSADLKILWANKSAVSISDKNIAGQTGRCYELWYGSSKQCLDCCALKSFETGRAERAQTSLPDGRLLDSRYFPIKDESGVVRNVIIVSTDITEKMKLEAQARRTSHLASLGELAAGIAHEINNPINGIINYAQILANRIDKQSRENDIAGRIIKEGDRIAGIVRNLLSFARERKEERRSENLQEILSVTITLTEVQIRKDDINLEIKFTEDLPQIVVNPQQIQQVFLNIISNARFALNQKFRGPHEDKKIIISAEKVEIDDSSYVRISFHDHGTGIPSDIIDKVMNPFFSTKPSGQGTGLGLSISHGIISDHSGRLMIESEEGCYTLVIIDLPAKETSGI